MRIRGIAAAVVAVAGVLGGASTARANMIVNGDFENSAEWSAWTFHAPGGNPAPAAFDFGIRSAAGAGHGTAANGSYVGGLEWYPDTATLSQAVGGFVVGGTYHLEWDLNLRVNLGNVNDSFGVFLDGIDLANPLFLGGSPQDWASGYTHVSVDFVATAATHTIIFGGQGFPSDVSYNIDNVSLGLKAVPEPASLGLMGLAGLGLIARRRRRSR